MSRINTISVVAIAALSAIVSGFAAPSAFAKNDTKASCCGMSCCQPASSCCDSTKTVKKVAMTSCCVPGAACCQPGSSCCAGANKAKRTSKKTNAKAAKPVVAKKTFRA